MPSRSSRRHILNGKLVSEEELLISPRDIGFLRGYGVFDFLITYKGKPFRLQDHIDRLFRSAANLDIRTPWSDRQISKWTFQALEANGDATEKAIRIVITGGVGPDSLTPSAGKPTLLVLVDPFVPPPREYYEKGAGIITAVYTRSAPGTKSLDYADGIMRMQGVKKGGVVEVVYYNNDQVFEGNTSNLFIVRKGIVQTTETDILPGITRKVVLEDLGITPPIQIKNFGINELRNADEVFLASSTKGVMPITRIDGQPVADGKVGPIAEDLVARFNAYVDSGNW